METVVPHFLVQTHSLDPYFTKSRFSDHVPRFLFFKKYCHCGNYPCRNMEKRIFLGRGKAPQRADDSTDLEAGPGSIFS